MPSVFNEKEMRMNCHFLILDNPKRLKPNSSGSGEAIIIAPTIISNQLK